MVTGGADFLLTALVFLKLFASWMTNSFLLISSYVEFSLSALPVRLLFGLCSLLKKMVQQFH
jgi:hypothetical protein